MIKLNFKKGFTLLEALVAVSILMVAVVAPMTVAQKGLSSANYSKSQMIASYLAQDAIEYIKNVRDQVAIRNNFDWTKLWDGNESPNLSTCLGGGGCEIDTNSGVGGVGLVQGYTDGALYKDADGFYGLESSGTAKTIFTRQIKIALSDKLDSKSNKYEALVTVTVGWTGGNSVEVKTLIFNY
jgi:type II secretory pathway pseudopilin PulG